MTSEKHIATVVVIAAAMVQAHDSKNARATQELTACLLSTARALPADEVARLCALVDAPVVQLLSEEMVVRPIASATNRAKGGG